MGGRVLLTKRSAVTHQSKICATLSLDSIKVEASDPVRHISVIRTIVQDTSIE